MGILVSFIDLKEVQSKVSSSQRSGKGYMVGLKVFPYGFSVEEGCLHIVDIQKESII